MSRAADLEVAVLAGEHERSPVVLLSRVNGRPRLEQVESDLLKAKEGWALACGSGWARASASVAV